MVVALESVTRAEAVDVEHDRGYMLDYALIITIIAAVIGAYVTLNFVQHGFKRVLTYVFGGHEPEGEPEVVPIQPVAPIAPAEQIPRVHQADGDHERVRILEETVDDLNRLLAEREFQLAQERRRCAHLQDQVQGMREAARDRDNEVPPHHQPQILAELATLRQQKADFQNRSYRLRVATCKFSRGGNKWHCYADCRSLENTKWEARENLCGLCAERLKRNIGDHPW